MLSSSVVTAQALSHTAFKDESKPWVFWYWDKAAASEQGVRQDLIAMKAEGFGGAYLMFISGQGDSALYQPAAQQLSPVWQHLLKVTFKTADSLNFPLAIHFSDGFATGGGPWITPDMSMQKVVWSEVNLKDGETFTGKLPLPNDIKNNYYRDIAIYAFPTPPDENISTNNTIPAVTTSAGDNVSYLADPLNKKSFTSSQPCQIKYSFEKPFTCRTIKIRITGINHQAKRLKISVSNDDKNFIYYTRLQPARSGWADNKEDITYSIPAVTAKYFRFEFDPDSTEPGSEDLDAAKWQAKFKINCIQLFGGARIDNYEGKNGSVWRISKRTDSTVIPDSVCIPLKSVKKITDQIDSNGNLRWQKPEGNWTIVRMGYTTTGQTNETGGGAKGLECDKFNPAAVRLQFDNWFKKIYDQAFDSAGKNIVKIFHADSWECGSQNWSPVFADAFKKYNGYDAVKYLPVIAGFPIENTDVSERFLYDIRTTISSLLEENFFGTVAGLAHKYNCQFSSESVAPVMQDDGMLHYKYADIPMGEFWLNSPTHDKPNDILDAVSGAHIYGKKIAQAESFTELRNEWNEYPAMVKTLQDRNYALGINRLVFHVFNESPWINRKPGMTLGGVGLFFQRQQTWWQPAKAWIDYTIRCQQLLQQGHPVIDLAVFNGEELPRRSVLPERLVNNLPGLFGKEKVEAEKKRLENKGNPIQEVPAGIKSSANITTPADWINALNGYQYDSFNKDALLHLFKVQNHQIILPGGICYKALLLPDLGSMNPNGNYMSLAVAEKLLQSVKEGATLIANQYPEYSLGLKNKNDDKKLKDIIDSLLGKKANFKSINNSVRTIRKGKVVIGAYTKSSLNNLGIKPDILFKNKDGQDVKQIAWTHRTDDTTDIYFLSNQSDSIKNAKVFVRVKNKIPEFYDAVNDIYYDAHEWEHNDDYTSFNIQLQPTQSLFVILKKYSSQKEYNSGENQPVFRSVFTLNKSWQTVFHKDSIKKDTVIFPQLTDWSKNQNKDIRYFSGTATYNTTFYWNGSSANNMWLSLGDVKNIASVKLNGRECGVAWTIPYRTDISKALKQGNNLLEISVTNTWANRLIGDRIYPKTSTTWTSAPIYLKDNELQPSGLLGPVIIGTLKN